MSRGLGILVHGSNHFIVRGPLPSPEAARELARLWEMPDLSNAHARALALASQVWRISTKEFRENLEWAVVLEAGEPCTPAVEQLLSELDGRGVVVLQCVRNQAGTQWQGAEMPADRVID